MENTSQKRNPAIEFSSDFSDNDFKMKIGGTVYEVSTHLILKAVGVYCSNSVT